MDLFKTIVILLGFVVFEIHGSDCFSKTGTLCSCGPDCQECRAPNVKLGYHLYDNCGMNDPNAPVYDPVHKMYHLFYQIHVAEVGGDGPDIGHFASKDLIHWTRLPVALWNDAPYDRYGVYTSSMGIVEGKVQMIYPGICFRGDAEYCTNLTGATLNIAKPSNYSDPLLIEWYKPKFNPVITGAQRDPTAPWKTKYGEYRTVTYDGTVYASTDFEKWYRVGAQTSFTHVPCECPSLFPLPGVHSKYNNVSVFKCSWGQRDYMQIGIQQHGKPNEIGTWTPLGENRLVDLGSLYATKDFFDPVKNRRILWGWARGINPTDAQCLPREITWDDELSQLLFNPLEEQEQLRGNLLGAQENIMIHASNSLPLGKSQLVEIIATFEIPNHPVNFGINLGTNYACFINYVPPSYLNSIYSVNVGCAPKSASNEYSYLPLSNEMLESNKILQGSLQLKPSDKQITIRIFQDRTLIEAFWQNGRVVLQSTIPNISEQNLQLFSNSDIKLIEAKAWEINPIWISKEDILKQ